MQWRENGNGDIFRLKKDIGLSTRSDGCMSCPRSDMHAVFMGGRMKVRARLENVRIWCVEYAIGCLCFCVVCVV